MGKTNDDVRVPSLYTEDNYLLVSSYEIRYFRLWRTVVIHFAEW